MLTKYNNPNQLELFAKAVNREELPLDAPLLHTHTAPLSPGIVTAVANLRKQLDDLNIH